MFITSHRFVTAIGFTVLTGLTLSPPAPAQMPHAMSFNSAQMVRPLGMMGLPSMGRPAFMIGMGMNPNMGMMGLNHVPMSPLGMPYAGAAGNYTMAPGTGYSQQPSQLNAYNQLPGTGPGYASISSSQDTKSSKESAGKTELKTLRLFAGGLSWPRALHYFTNDGNLKELRDGIDTQVETLLAREDGKPVPTDLLDGLKGNVDKLRKRFVAQSYDIPMTSQQEADARRFLSKLKSALEHFSTTAAVSTSPK
jgi:hypothetical protein